MNFLYPLFAGLFGLLIGSFLNVVIYRLPRGRSIVRPRSHCPRCRRLIRSYDNIPLVSFLLLKGRCRSCRKPISWRYPLVEMISGLLALLVSWKFTDPLVGAAYYLFFVAPLIVVSGIDFRHKIIPNRITLPGILIGLWISFWLGGWHIGSLLHSFLGAITGGGALFLVGFCYEKLRGVEGLGMGDVKLAAMLGAYFGWNGVLFILLISSLLGSVIGLILLLVFKKGRTEPIPYGPFLSLAGLIQLFFGKELIGFYLNLSNKLY
ncbi:MAG: prepilin peptidase [Deltaproteobacteria bacterium]|nr:prepilin peptidase [Deltaproteobacteria bacterium]MBI4374357.1 prepilin peptidase [Deltaproteobacteria bacterium]